MADDATKRLLIEIDRTVDPVVVRCRGRLVAGVTDSLHAEVSPLLPSAKRIVLDLTDLTHMDSMGLATIVRLYVSAKAAGCALQLINFGPRIRHLLDITRLLPVLADIGRSGIPYI